MMMRSSVFVERLLLCVSLCCCTTTAISSAQAEPNRVLAEALFQRGRELMDEGKFDLACVKFADSLQAERSTGTMLNLARCHAKQGKTASAWAEYRRAASLSRNESGGRREKAALRLAAALEPKLCKLTIGVADPVAGLIVKRDGSPAPSSSFGVAIPVDPGSTLIEASAPGYESFRRTVAISGEGKMFQIRIPRLVKRAVVAAAPLPPGPMALTPGPADRPSNALQGDSVQRPLGFAIIGLGVVGLGVGTGLGVSVLNSRSAVLEDASLCGQSPAEDGQPIGCTPAGLEAVDAAREHGGRLAAVGGFLVTMLAPNTSETKSSTRALFSSSWNWAPVLTPAGAGGVFSTRF